MTQQELISAYCEVTNLLENIREMEKIATILKGTLSKQLCEMEERNEKK